MDIKALIRENAQLVEARLNELLPGEDISPTTLHKAMRYSVFAGGKRIRPMLCLEACRACYDGKPGVALMDDIANNVWPTPLDSTNGDTCYVGRIRKDLAIDNALNLWVVGDQVRKGAALNAVQIAELLVSRA